MDSLAFADLVNKIIQGKVNSNIYRYISTERLELTLKGEKYQTDFKLFKDHDGQGEAVSIHHYTADGKLCFSKFDWILSDQYQELFKIMSA